MAASELPVILENACRGVGPKRKDLNTCVHCGLCLNACPTYRELGLEADSPRGRVYQMIQVLEGRAQIDESYQSHIDLCLACRACESACPSGVPYGRLVEAARAEIDTVIRRPFLERAISGFVFGKVLPSKAWLKALSIPLRIYQTSGIETLVKKTGILSKFPRLAGLATLSPRVQSPSFFAQYGKTFAPEGERRYRVAMLGGCMANVCFARLHEATVRVLQWNGCEVVVPPNQTCCGALHLHAGRKKEAQRLARQNVDALLDGGFDAIITNTAGCGCALKEYHELLEDAPAYAERAHAFSGKVKDVSEFLNSIGFRPPTREVNALVTYQDSCHLTHGQKLPGPPRKLLQSIPGIRFREMPFSDHCCGSAGIYNVLHTDMSMRLLRKKMANANSTEAEIITSANPGCLLQLEAGVRLHGNGQRVMHVIELLDEAYGGKEGLPQA